MMKISEFNLYTNSKWIVSVFRHVNKQAHLFSLGGICLIYLQPKGSIPEFLNGETKASVLHVQISNNRLNVVNIHAFALETYLDTLLNIGILLTTQHFFLRCATVYSVSMYPLAFDNLVSFNVLESKFCPAAEGGVRDSILSKYFGTENTTSIFNEYPWYLLHFIKESCFTWSSSPLHLILVVFIVAFPPANSTVTKSSLINVLWLPPSNSA